VETALVKPGVAELRLGPHLRMRVTKGAVAHAEDWRRIARTECPLWVDSGHKLLSLSSPASWPTIASGSRVRRALVAVANVPE
jgi:hypothetical protein